MPVAPIRFESTFTRSEIRAASRHQIMHSRAFAWLACTTVTALFLTVVGANDLRLGDDAHGILECGSALGIAYWVVRAVPEREDRTWAAFERPQPVGQAFSEDGAVFAIFAGRTSYVPWSSVAGYVVTPGVGYAIVSERTHALVNGRCVPPARLADFDALLARRAKRFARYD